MFYLKHPQHGNRHVASLDECKRLQSEGWTRWPRTKDEKEGRAPAKAEPTAPPAEAVKVAVGNTLKLNKT